MRVDAGCGEVHVQLTGPANRAQFRQEPVDGQQRTVDAGFGKLHQPGGDGVGAAFKGLDRHIPMGTIIGTIDQTWFRCGVNLDQHGSVR